MRTWFLVAFAFAVPATSATIQSGCAGNADFRIQISAWDDLGSEYTEQAGRQLASFGGCAAVNMSFQSESLREGALGLASTSHAAMDAGSARMLLRILTDASVLQFDDGQNRRADSSAVLTSQPVRSSQSPSRPLQTAPGDAAAAVPAIAMPVADQHGAEPPAASNVSAVLAAAAPSGPEAASTSAAAPHGPQAEDVSAGTELAGSDGADNVPEPASLVLAAVGLAVLRGLARRRPRVAAR